MRCVYVRLKWRSVAVAVIPLTLVRKAKGADYGLCPHSFARCGLSSPALTCRRWLSNTAVEQGRPPRERRDSRGRTPHAG